MSYVREVMCRECKSIFIVEGHDVVLRCEECEAKHAVRMHDKAAAKKQMARKVAKASKLRHRERNLEKAIKSLPRGTFVCDPFAALSLS